jgi:hypothetical protein
VLSRWVVLSTRLCFALVLMQGRVLRVLSPNRVVVLLEPNRSVVELELVEAIPEERLSMARTATALHPFQADWIHPGEYRMGKFLRSSIGVKWTRQANVRRGDYHLKKQTLKLAR